MRYLNISRLLSLFNLSFMENIRKEFPILSQKTYFNTASSGIVFNDLANFRKKHDQEFINEGSIFRDDQRLFLSNVRSSIAHFFDTTISQVTLNTNCSIGFNILFDGLSKSNKILLIDDDYPSINFAITSKGFNTCFVSIEAEVIVEDAILSTIEKERPDVFVFSIVQYLTGIALDLSFIKKIKQTYPDLLLIADGTQFCGTQSFSFKDSGIDVLGCSGYKWLLGGYGNGFLLFKEGILEQLTPLSYRNDSYRDKYPASYTDLQARFEPGHLDTFNFGSLQRSLSFLSTIGMDFINDQHALLKNYLQAEFAKLGLLSPIVLKRENHGSIVHIKGGQELHYYLKEQQIITSLKPNGIRISTHFYNTTEDIDRLVFALKNIKALS